MGDNRFKPVEFYLDCIIACALFHGVPVSKINFRRIREARKAKAPGVDCGDNALNRLNRRQGWTWDDLRSAAQLRAEDLGMSIADEDDDATRHVSAPSRVETAAVGKLGFGDDSDWDDEDTLVNVMNPLLLHEQKVVTYVVTWAQNNTPIDENFWASLLHYVEERDAKLIVIKGRYKNPTSIWTDNNKKAEKWAPQVEPFAINHRVQLCDGLVVYGDVPIQPTAVTPLTGFARFGRDNAIFGHPKVQLTAIAGAEREKTRIHLTTGACTVVNYTHSKAGKKGESHHVLGATVVEVKGSKFFIRQLNASTKTGAFIDLDKEYSPYGVSPAPRPEALVLGDVHVAQVDEEVVEASLTRPDSIAMTLKPKKLVYHDVLDFKSRSHHRIKDPDELFASHHLGEPNNVELEMVQAVNWLDAHTPDWAEGFIVGSNHDEHADRWLKECNPNKDPENAVFYHKLRAEKLERYQRDAEWTPAFTIAYDWWGDGRIRFMNREESLEVRGIELNFHGDKGLNGSRGNLQAYAKLGVKVVIGHSHSPGILDGAYQVGHSSNPDHGYNDKPSSWMHAHCLIYANGKRTLLFVSEGEWCAQPPQPLELEAA